MRWAMLFALLLVAILPGRADASCGNFAPATPRVVLDAVALNGPETRDGFVGTPVRLFVLAYRKGSGPRVIRVHSADQVGLGNVGGWISDTPSFRAGQVVRVHLYAPPRGVVGLSTCGESFGTARPGLMRRVAERVAGPSRAEVRTGAHGLRCLRVDGRARCSAGRRGLVKVRAGDGATAVAAWAPSLRRMEVSVRGAPAVVATASRAAPALVRLPGEHEPYDVRVRLVHADGSTEIHHGDAARRAFAADPEVESRWSAFSAQDDGDTCAVAHNPGAAVSGRRPVTCLRRPGRGFFAVQPAVDANTLPLPRVVVYGIARGEVADLSLATPDGSVPVSRARHGGAFLAVLPATTDVRRLVLRATYADGSTATFDGRLSGRF